MHFGCDRVSGNGEGPGGRGREIDEVTECVHQEESGALCLSDYQTRTGADGDVPAGDSQLNHREESWGPYHRCHPHHGDVREQRRHVKPFQKGTLERSYFLLVR